MKDFKKYIQNSPNDSPRTIKERVGMLLWEYIWSLLCSWTPKPANSWRIFWLRVFGAKVYGKPFVHQRARIFIPWNLILHDRAALGDRTNAYTQGIIEVKERATIAQEAYLCTGTHNFTAPAMNLITAPIIIGAGAFIGARAFIMPGVTIGDGAIVGACSVVTKHVEAGDIVVGTPAKKVNPRNFQPITA